MSVKVILWCVVLLCVCGCSMNAERDNPLDPDSPDYTSIAGRVADRGLHPVAGALVTAKPVGLHAYTDDEGRYSIAGLRDGTFVVTAEAQGYQPDSQEVSVKKGNTASADFLLNARPYLEWVRSISAHEPIWPLDIYYAELSAHPGDGDGTPDIESLHVAIAGIGYERRMTYDHNLGCFFHTVVPESLPGGTLHDIIGKEILFTVVDKQGGCGFGSSGIARIVEPLPEIVSPKQGEQVSRLPVLRWRFYTQYEVSYSIKLYSSQPVGLVWSRDSIAQHEDSIVVSDSLEQGPHYWILTATDIFGNRARSEEASFIAE